MHGPLGNPAPVLHQFLVHDGNLAGRPTKADDQEEPMKIVRIV